MFLTTSLKTASTWNCGRLVKVLPFSFFFTQSTLPAGRYNTSAAVMIWFYGGAFKVCCIPQAMCFAFFAELITSPSMTYQEGGESFALYDGAYIASNTNTIVIATNYRIDVLGWLYLNGVRLSFSRLLHTLYCNIPTSPL